MPDAIDFSLPTDDEVPFAILPFTFLTSSVFGIIGFITSAAKTTKQ